MNIFVAGKWADRDKLAVFANKLKSMGHYITSHWLTSGNEDEDEGSWADYAIRDQLDICAADLFILFTEENPPKRNSRLVELGIAIAAKKEITIIGRIETIYCTRADNHYATAEDCLIDMGSN